MGIERRLRGKENDGEIEMLTQDKERKRERKRDREENSEKRIENTGWEE